MLPPRTARCWVAFAEGRIEGPFDLLAVRVLAMRMRIASRRAPDREDLARRVDEVYAFFAANEALAEADLKRIAEVTS